MDERATRVRFRILGLLLLYAALVHFNRISIAVAGTERLMSQFNISETLMGWMRDGIHRSSCTRRGCRTITKG